jgi:hypothetical protein
MNLELLSTETPRVSTRAFVKNIISPSVNQVKAHKLAKDHPVVGRSPYDYDGLASTVVNVPQAEIDEFLDKVVSRYIRTIQSKFYTVATCSNEYLPLSDEELCQVFQNSLYSRFVRMSLDPIDYDYFGDHIEGQKSYCKVDFAHLDHMESLPEFNYCRTITLFSIDGGKLTLEAIKIKDIVVTPTDPDWVKSKLFVVQGAVLSVLICDLLVCPYFLG